jgi:hypothetical protein
VCLTSKTAIAASLRQAVPCTAIDRVGKASNERPPCAAIDFGERLGNPLEVRIHGLDFLEEQHPIGVESRSGGAR